MLGEKKKTFSFSFHPSSSPPRPSKMATTDDEATTPVQQTNGAGGATANGGDSDEEDASKLRPVNIEQDMREMERRKRVEAIMSSKLFREELERVVNDSIAESGADGISSMLSEMMKSKGGGGGGGAITGLRGELVGHNF